MPSKQHESSEQGDRTDSSSSSSTPVHVKFAQQALMPSRIKFAQQALMPSYVKFAQQAVISNYVKLGQQAVMASHIKLAQQALISNYVKFGQQAVMANHIKLAQQAVIPNFTNLIRDASAEPRFSQVLREVIAPPGVANYILSSIRPSLSVPSVAGYGTAATVMFRSFGLDSQPHLAPLNVRPTTDDTAFRVIAQASPETALAISQAAESAGNPLLPSHIIRNMLAWFVVALIVVSYVGGTVLFPPWGPAVVALLGASGVSAPGAYSRIQPKRDRQRASP